MAILFFTGTTPGTFSVASNWTPSQVPTINDICIFTSSSPTCSITTIGTCSQIDFTNYNKRISFATNSIAVYGNITLGNQMSFTFSTTTNYNGYNLIMASGGSITTNGMTMGVPFMLYNPIGSNNTYNIVDNLKCSENFSTGAATVSLTHTINGATISLYKGFGLNLGVASTTTSTIGSSNIIMLGTGNLTGGSSTVNGGLGNQLIINNGSNVTLTTNIYVRNILNLLSSSTTGAFNFIFTNIGTFSATPFSAGTFSKFGLGTSAATAIVNLTTDFYTIRQLNTIGGQFNNGNIYTIGGISNATNTLTGNSILYISGTGPASSSNINASTGYNLNTIINTPGLLTIAGTIWNGSIFTYTAGNVNITGTVTINTTSTPTLTMPSSKFLLVVIGAAQQTFNLLSNWNITTLSTSNQNITFTGSNVWTTDIFNNTLPPWVLTLRDGFTYSILKQINISPNNYNGNLTIQSGASGSYTNLYLAPGATQTIYSLNMKDVNNVGTPLWIFNPTYSNTTNIWTLNYLSPQQTTISGF